MKKNSLSRSFKCLKCFVIFYLVFICIMSLGVAAFASYLLLFREESRIPEPRTIVLYFLLSPTILTILSTVLGWKSIEKKNISLLKLFAVLLAATAVVEISGCVWCFISLPKVNVEIQSHLKMEFDKMATSNSKNNWWQNLQVKHECCGLQGPTDYHSSNSIPFSCCGSDPEDRTSGSCTFLWQKGCSKTVEKQINNDLILLSLTALCSAIFRIPGVFLSCTFAKKMSKESI